VSAWAKQTPTMASPEVASTRRWLTPSSPPQQALYQSPLSSGRF
jgi:hypothetical protein